LYFNQRMHLCATNEDCHCAISLSAPTPDIRISADIAPGNKA
jgi:hypothetical protein